MTEATRDPRSEPRLEGLFPPLRSDLHGGPLRLALHLLYDALWLLAAVLGSPWLLWKSQRVPGFGRMVLERLGRGLASLPRGDRPRVLVHGVSVGEVKAARSLVRVLEEQNPGVEIIVSTTTVTGTEVAEGLFQRNRVVRFPADLSFLVARFLRRVDPALVVLIELEIWPNLLRQCNRRGIPVAVVNGRITRGSHGRYLVFRHLLPQFDRISLFCVQSEEYAARFRALGVDEERLIVTGNVKVDGLRLGRVDPSEEILRLLGPRPGQRVLVAGSTHEPEELWLAEAAATHVPAVRLVLVPRHPKRCDDLAQRLARSGTQVQRLSVLRRGGELPDPSRPALVDTIGELEGVYGLADLVFVGGTLVPHGGQNMLEPAAQGRPALYGPSVENFVQEAELLRAAGASYELAERSELGPALAELLADEPRCRAMGAAGMQAVASQGGATELTCRALARLEFPSNRQDEPAATLSRRDAAL